MELWQINPKTKINVLQADAATFSADGKNLALYDWSGINIQDFSTSNVVKKLEKPDYSGNIESIQYTPDGNLLMGIAEDRLSFWGLDDKEFFRIFHIMGPFLGHPVFDPSGKCVIATEVNQSTITLSQIDPREKIETTKPKTHSSSRYSVKYKSDGGSYTLTISDKKSQKNFNLEAQKPDSEFGYQLDNYKLNNPVYLLSPNEQHLAYSDYYEERKSIEDRYGKKDYKYPSGNVKILDFNTNRVAALNDRQVTQKLTFSSDSRLVISVGISGVGYYWQRDHIPIFSKKIWSTNYSTTVKIWNIPRQELLGAFDFYHGDQPALFSADGKIIALGKESYVLNGILAHLVGHIEPVVYASINPNETQAFTWSENLSALLWDIQTGKVIESFPGLPRLKFSATGKYFVPVPTLDQDTDSDEFSLWTVGDVKEPKLFKGTAGVINADENLVATALGKEIKLWDLQTEKEIATLSGATGHGDTVTCLAFSPDSRLLASGSEDQTIRLWDVPTAKMRSILRDGEATVIAVAFSNDGQILASSTESKSNSAIKLWDVPTGNLIRTIATYAQNTHLVFSPDDKLLFSKQEETYLETIKIWNTKDGTQFGELDHSINWVSHVQFDSEGNLLLASTLPDNTIQLWRQPPKRFRVKK